MHMVWGWRSQNYGYDAGHMCRMGYKEAVGLLCESSSVVWGWMSPWRLWFWAHVHNGATKSQLGFLSESSRVVHWQSFFFVIMLNQTCREYNFLQPQLCVPLFFFCLFASLTHHQMLWFPCVENSSDFLFALLLLGKIHTGWEMKGSDQPYHALNELNPLLGGLV